MDSAAALHAGRMLEAMLLEPLLRPLLAGADTLGEYGLGLLARGIAERDERGFATLVAGRLRRVP